MECERESIGIVGEGEGERKEKRERDALIYDEHRRNFSRGQGRGKASTTGKKYINKGKRAL